MDFADRAARLRPADAQAIGSITRSYVQLRYGANASAAELERLRELVGRFRPA